MHRPGTILAVAIAIAAVLAMVFVLCGGLVTEWTRELLDSWKQTSPLVVAGSCVGLLLADVVLPVPSSLICTAAGAILGPVVGALVVWLGLNLAALAAWGAGRWGLATSRAERLPAQTMNDARNLVWLVALARPLPLLAETALITAGALRIGLPRLAWPVAFANGAIAVIWTTLGAWASEHEWLGIVAVLATIVPVAAAALVVSRVQGPGNV